MHILRCTARLLQALGISRSGLVELEDAGLFGSWYANLLVVDRRTYLLFTNAVSLFSFVALDVKRKDLVLLREFFLDRMAKALEAEGVPAAVVQGLIDPCVPLYVARTASKSVLGSMNDLSNQLEWMVRRDGGVSSSSELEIGHQLNRTPMSALGYKRPVERLFEMLKLPQGPAPAKAISAVAQRESEVRQFRIALDVVEPPIWRRIQVPWRYTFWDLHVAIQDAFGWEDRHLHEFVVLKPSSRVKVAIGIPTDYGMELHKVLPGWKERIAHYFTPDNRRAVYSYDFGDGWEHSVELEECSSTKGIEDSPACLDGSRACPPEDCGGPEAYMEMARNTRQARKLGLDPEKFEASAVVFDDPADRWHWSFNAAVLLDNEMRRVLLSPPPADRHGRYAFRVPLMCRDRILDQCFLDSELHSRFKTAPLKSEGITVKLDVEEIENLLGLLAAAANHAKKRFDQMVFRSLCGHLSTCSSILAKK